MSATESGPYGMVPARAVDDTAMTPPLLRMLVCLATYGNRDGWCHPKRETLAARLGVSTSRVSQLTSKLAALGYIEREHTHLRGGRQGVNQYRVILNGILPAERDRYPLAVKLGVSSSANPGGKPIELTPRGKPIELTPINRPYEQTTGRATGTAVHERAVTPPDIWHLDGNNKAQRDWWAASPRGVAYLMAGAHYWEKLSESSKWYHYREWIHECEEYSQVVE